MANRFRVSISQGIQAGYASLNKLELKDLKMSSVREFVAKLKLSLSRLDKKELAFVLDPANTFWFQWLWDHVQHWNPIKDEIKLLRPQIHRETSSSY